MPENLTRAELAVFTPCVVWVHVGIKNIAAT